MGGNFPVAYLLILVAVSAVTILILKAAQKTVSSELKDMLYLRRDVNRYLEMLQSRRLRLVFRKNTLFLMRLEGVLEQNDLRTAAGLFGEAESGEFHFHPEERLYLEQRRMDWAIQNGRRKDARDALKSLETLLKDEKSAKLKAVLADARLLEGVYVEKDTGLIPRLLSLEKEQTGSMRGITRFRLAKLFWFGKDEKNSREYLMLAKSDLTGTAWQKRVERALTDSSCLEVL